MKVFYASTKTGVRGAVREVLEAMDFRRLLLRKEDILVKINLTWDYLRPGVNTSPWVVEAFAEAVGDHVGRIYLGESSQILVDAGRAFRVTRMKEAAERHGLSWQDFSKNRWVPAEADGLSFGIPEICTRMPVVSIPVVKTHYRSVISVALKHLYGCLDDNRHNYHYRLTDYVLAVNSVIPAALTLADGTFSLEGSGPKPGIPKQTDFVAASADRVALDYSVSCVMGIDPLSVDTTVRGNGRVGTFEGLEEVCLPPMAHLPAFHFAQAVPNFVARVEKVLRGGRRRKGPGTDGPLIGIMKYGAKRWYNLAYYLLGQNRQAGRIIGQSIYGPQWKGLPEQR
ncbi:MAG: DUF362 domain-containing protein [Candidatus Fermentibacteraceae bacterium]|nr:DUF362 domain-containing protein [Candidatus Fermentibacteraceae bacterium]MBN2609671.1 DUF362 domain-containing protein [Candidatus Fermentibacteraceae bacterium]